MTIHSSSSMKHVREKWLREKVDSPQSLKHETCKGEVVEENVGCKSDIIYGLKIEFHHGRQNGVGKWNSNLRV